MNSISVLRIQFTFFFNPFLVCRVVCPWCTSIADGGLGVTQKPEGFRCSEVHSQPYLSTLTTFCYIKICTMTSNNSLFCLHVAGHVSPNIKVVGYYLWQ